MIIFVLGSLFIALVLLGAFAWLERRGVKKQDDQFEFDFKDEINW